MWYLQHNIELVTKERIRIQSNLIQKLNRSVITTMYKLLSITCFTPTAQSGRYVVLPHEGSTADLEYAIENTLSLVPPSEEYVGRCG